MVAVQIDRLPRLVADTPTDRGWLEGDEAIEAVQQILATPGDAGIDFETSVIRGGTKKRPTFKAVPAHRREAYVLSVHHAVSRRSVVAWLGDDAKTQGRVLRAMLSGVGATLVAHHADFEVQTLVRYGIEVDVECTMLAARCLELVAVPHGAPQPKSFSLAACAERFLGHVRDKTVRERDWSTRAALDPVGVEYARQDAEDTVRLWQVLRWQLEDEGLLEGYRVLQRSILPSAWMTNRGLMMDGKAHGALCEQLGERSDRLLMELYDASCWRVANHASTKQVSDWIIGRVCGKDEPTRTRFDMRLRSRTGSDWKRTGKTGNLRIGKGDMARKPAELDEHWPDVAAYLRIRAEWVKVAKLINAFGPALAKQQEADERVRGQYHTMRATTGRQSCTDPNLQQQPRDPAFRALWVAPEGYKLIIADYSQIELRLAAIIAEDERLMEVYRQKRDVHTENAAIAYAKSPENVTRAERQNGKGVGFASVYGAGAAGIAEGTGISLKDAETFLGRFLDAYQGLAEYREQAPRRAEALGYIEIIPNRRVLYDSTKKLGTMAINYGVQGGAASVQMLAIRRVYDRLKAEGLRTELVASIHDEILLEAPLDEVEAASQVLVEEMTGALVALFPQAEEMGMSELAAASAVDTWAGKS